MKKFWLVFRYEYLRHVLRKRFLFALMSIPLFILLMIGVVFLTVWLQSDMSPAGYVDLSGRLANARPVPEQSDILIPNTVFRPYATADEAQRDLQAGAIQGYFVLPVDYFQSGKIQYIAQEGIKERTQTDFREFLRFNLVRDYPEQVRARAVKGAEITIRSLDGSRSAAESDFMSVIIPFLSGLIFIIVINVSGSYLVQALVEEKENRTMEIVVTSVSAEQLMAGKVAGNLGVGLTQLIIWILVGIIGLWFADVNLNFEVRVDAQLLTITLLTLLPGFIMVAGLMAAAGATTTDTREAQQLSGFFTLPVVIPYWFVGVLMESPNSPLSVGMSLFPLTAPVALPMRAAFTQIPFWQLALSIGLVCLFAAGAVWLAARAFRLGMLRYGKHLSWKEVFGRGGVK